MKPRKDYVELKRAVETAGQADTNRDRLRLMAAEHPEAAADIAKLIEDATERTIAAYRVLVYRILALGEYKSMLASEYGRKNPGDPELRESIRKLWRELGEEGIPERERAAIIAERMRTPKRTIQEHIKKMNLRTKKQKR